MSSDQANEQPSEDSQESSTKKTKKSFWKKVKRNWKELSEKLRVWGLVIALAFVFILALLYKRIVHDVLPGESGVVWKRFGGGTDTERIYREGVHFIWPWNRIYIYNVRIQQKVFEFDALSKNGLPIHFEISARYRPFQKTLPLLHQQIGPDYLEKIVIPEVQANLRHIVANYLPEQIYTSGGYLLQIIKQGAIFSVAERHVLLDDLLIKRMVLPEYIRKAIERKLEQEQASLEYEFRLEKELKEAERKKTESEGIRVFLNNVTAEGNFDKYLSFYGVQATLALAKSNNSKIVIIGGGKNQLPLILNMPEESAKSQSPESTTSNFNSTLDSLNTSSADVHSFIPQVGIVPNEAETPSPTITK